MNNFRSDGEDIVECIEEHKEECTIANNNAETEYENLFKNFNYDHEFYCEFNLRMYSLYV